MPWTAPRTWVTSEIVTATLLNVHLRDNLNWNYSGDAAWQEVLDASMSNSWVNYDTTTFGPCRFKKVGPFIALYGLIKNGTVGAHAFTLPVGYRPDRNQIWGTNSNGATAGGAFNTGGQPCELRVHTTGTVVIQVSPGGNAYCSVDCVFLQGN